MTLGGSGVQERGLSTLSHSRETPLLLDRRAGGLAAAPCGTGRIATSTPGATKLAARR